MTETFQEWEREEKSYIPLFTMLRWVNIVTKDRKIYVDDQSFNETRPHDFEAVILG